MCGRKLEQNLSVLNYLTLILLLAFKRKLAVCASIGGWLGIGRWPRAIPTMAVMWVSVPNTWIGIPVVLPGQRKLQNREDFDS